MGSNKWSATDIYTEEEYEKGFLKPNAKTGPTGQDVWYTSYIEEYDPELQVIRARHGNKAEYNAAVRKAIAEKASHGYDIYDDKNQRWITKGPGYKQDTTAERAFQSYPEPTKAELYKEHIQNQNEMGEDYENYHNYDDEDWRALNDTNKAKHEAHKIEEEHQLQADIDRMEKEVEEAEAAKKAQEEKAAALAAEEEELSLLEDIDRLHNEIDETQTEQAVTNLHNNSAQHPDEAWLSNLEHKGAAGAAGKTIAEALEAGNFLAPFQVGTHLADNELNKIDNESKERPHNIKLYWDPETGKRYYVNGTGQKVKDPYEDRVVTKMGSVYIPQHRAHGEWKVDSKTGDLYWNGEDPAESGGYMRNPTAEELRQHQVVHDKYTLQKLADDQNQKGADFFKEKDTRPAYQQNPMPNQKEQYSILSEDAPFMDRHNEKFYKGSKHPPKGTPASGEGQYHHDVTYPALDDQGYMIDPEGALVVDSHYDKFQKNAKHSSKEISLNGDDKDVFFNNTTATHTSNYNVGKVTNRPTVYPDQAKYPVATKTAPTIDLSDRWRYKTATTTNSTTQFDTQTKTSYSYPGQSSSNIPPTLPSPSSSSTNSTKRPGDELPPTNMPPLKKQKGNDSDQTNSFSRDDDAMEEEGGGGGGGGGRSGGGSIASAPSLTIGQQYKDSLTTALGYIESRYKPNKPPTYLPKVLTTAESFLRK